MTLTLTKTQINKLFGFKPNNIIVNDEDNFTILHNVIADIKTYLQVNDMPVIATSSFKFDNTRVFTIELPKQAIIISCHGAGYKDDLFNMYDITLQVTKL